MQNTSTTHSHEPGHLPTFPHTDRFTKAHAPSFPPRTCYNNRAVHIAAHGLVHAVFIRAVLCWDFRYFTILHHPGECEIRARQGASPRPRSPSRASASISLPGIQGADLWGGRGEVVVPRGVVWRSAITAVSFICVINYFFKDPFGHQYHHYRGAVYNIDFRFNCLFVRAHFANALRD